MTTKRTFPSQEKAIRLQIGGRIRELRKSLGLTSVKLGQMVDVSQSQLSKIETGKTAVSIDVLTELCHALDRPLSYLFQKEEEIPRVLGTMTTVAGPESRAIEWFAEEVNRLSQGSMSLIPLKANLLGSAPDQVEMLRQGVLDIFIEELIFYQRFSDRVKVTPLPYMFQDDSHYMAYLNSAYFKNDLERKLNQQGLQLLNTQWNWRRGVEKVLVSKTPILHPDDIKGLRVRVFDAPVVARFWELMGAQPIIVPWPKVGKAWEQNDFDILPTNKAHLYPMEFCRHGRYVTLLGDVPPVLAATVNKRKYASLPPTVQQALIEACDNSGDFFSREVKTAEKENEKANLEEFNAVYLKVALTPWRDAAAHVIETLITEKQIPSKSWDTVGRLAADSAEAG